MTEKTIEAAKKTDSALPATEAPIAAAPTRPQSQQVEVDDSHITATYANFCRVTGSPEELILDFGLNSQPVGASTKPLQLTQRIVLNYYTAKRLLTALGVSLERHEGAFGVLETDVQKRVTRGALQRAAQSGN